MGNLLWEVFILNYKQIAPLCSLLCPDFKPEGCLVHSLGVLQPGWDMWPSARPQSPVPLAANSKALTAAALFVPSIQVGIHCLKIDQAVNTELSLNLCLSFLPKLNLCPLRLIMHLYGHANGNWVAGTHLMMGFKPCSLVFS